MDKTCAWCGSKCSIDKDQCIFCHCTDFVVDGNEAVTYIKELETILQQERDIRSDREIHLQLIAERIGLKPEPHQTYWERMLEEIDRLRGRNEQLEAGLRQMLHDPECDHQAIAWNLLSAEPEQGDPRYRDKGMRVTTLPDGTTRTQVVEHGPTSTPDGGEGALAEVLLNAIACLEYYGERDNWTPETYKYPGDWQDGYSYGWQASGSSCPWDMPASAAQQLRDVLNAPAGQDPIWGDLPAIRRTLREPRVPEYRANFLWPHEDETPESHGYEFANANTEEYAKQRWELLKGSLSAGVPEAVRRLPEEWRRWADAVEATRVHPGSTFTPECVRNCADQLDRAITQPEHSQPDSGEES